MHLRWLLCAACYTALLGCSERRQATEPAPSTTALSSAAITPSSATSPSADRDGVRATASSAPTTPPLSVTIASATARRSTSTLLEPQPRKVQDMAFELDVRVHNEGEALNMLTNFNSILDGFELHTTASDGTQIASTHYTFHQSPFAQDRAIPVAKGTTTLSIVVPFQDWTSPADVVHLHLEGGFRGTPWAVGLVSNTVPVRIPQP